MYEGYQLEDYSPSRHVSNLRVSEESNDVNFAENLAHNADVCYDADTSNNSVDYHMSTHEEVNQATLHRGFGEAAARGAKHEVGFYPISEDTVFMDPPSDRLGIEPAPYDKWLLYSGSSSSSSSGSSGDEYCCGQLTVADSEDTSSDFEMLPDCGVLKRNRQTSHRVRLYNDEADGNAEDQCASISKRLRAKDGEPRATDGDANVDVRMIDFAHTSIGRSSIEVASNSSATTVHQGPDSGFLTGLDSLKRLLMEILTEG